MTVFVEVARAGSFSAAAHRLNMSTTAVSRHVVDLERLLGVTLLRRTTRHVSPTEEGARYLPRAEAILGEIEQLNAEISASDPTPRGRLKITAPPAVGHEVIAPIVVDFVEAYPEIEVEIDLTERLVDLVAEGFDAAIRAGPLESSSMIAHQIEMRYLICASPSYLERRSSPERPQNISEHDCIHWRAAVISTRGRVRIGSGLFWQPYEDALGLRAIEDKNSPVKPDPVLFRYGRRPLSLAVAKG